MHGNAQRGIVPLVTIIIVLLIVAGGIVVLQKTNDRKAAPGETSAGETDAQNTGITVPGKDAREAGSSDAPEALLNEAREQTGGTAGAPSKAAPVTVRYTADGFSPREVKVQKGQSIVWKNERGGGMWVASAIHPTHSVYAGTSLTAHCPAGGAEAFDQCGSGEEFRFTFEKTGTWKYHDHLNAAMTGTVIVE